METELKTIINTLTKENKKLVQQIEELKHFIYELKLLLYGTGN